MYREGPNRFAPVTVPPPIMSFAIEPKSRGDEEKITGALHRLLEEDPTLNFYRNEETKEMILSGMGQLHIEVTVEKMKRKFGVEVNLNIPKVPYKETIKGQKPCSGEIQEAVRWSRPVWRLLDRTGAPPAWGRFRICR